MPDMAFRFRRNLTYVHRRFREWRMLWKGIASTDHPVLAHIIPMRRCNLACAYCNEYDDVSKPVPLETMTRRLDRLHALGGEQISIRDHAGHHAALPNMGDNLVELGMHQGLSAAD